MSRQQYRYEEGIDKGQQRPAFWICLNKQRKECREASENERQNLETGKQDCKEGKFASDVNRQDSVDLLFTAETF